MKHFMAPVIAAGLAYALAGCAVDPDEPAINTVSSNVTANAHNWVLACYGLALRSCDNPGACAFATMSLGENVAVGQVDWNTRMAYVALTPEGQYGWAAIDGANGPLLSVTWSTCN
jgi:hypothetical protein